MNKRFHEEIEFDEEILLLVKNCDKLDFKLLKLKCVLFCKLAEQFNHFWQVKMSQTLLKSEVLHESYLCDIHEGKKKRNEVNKLTKARTLSEKQRSKMKKVSN